jgi:site-specific DNA recombinase
MKKLDSFKVFQKTDKEEIIVNKVLIGYSRISSKQQESNYSIADQEKSLREYALQHNYEMREIIGGVSESAKGDFTRKEFKRLFDTIKQRKNRPYAIAVKFISRFSRNGGKAIGLVSQMIDDLNVHLLETSTGLCTDKPKDKNEIYRKLLEAEEENTQRLERTIPGMKSFLEAGNHLGIVPFGYIKYGRRVSDFERMAEKQRIEITEDGRIFQLAWQWKLQGESNVAISERLANMGVVLNYKRLSVLFRNPFYCGVLVHKFLKEPKEGNWEPLVSMEVFWKVQALLAPQTLGTYQISNSNDARPLARHLICSQCNNLLTGYEVKKKRKHYYKCNVCRGVSLNAETSPKSPQMGINDTYKKLLESVQLKGKYTDLFKYQLLKLFRYQNAEHEMALTEQKTKLGDLMIKKNKLEEKYIYGDDITKEVYKQRSSQLEWEINATHQKIADLENKLSNHDIFIDKAMNVCENLSKYWECGTSENKQRIQKMLFPEGLYIVPEKRTYLTQNMNQVFQLIPLFTGVSEGHKTKKVTISDDFSLLVAGTGLEPVTFGL